VADFTSGNIYEFKPDGTRSTFASGVQAYALAFDKAGDLFEGDNSGNIYEFTPAGARSTFASGVDVPYGLAFDGVGNLFVSSGGTGFGDGCVYKFTPDGAQSTFASGLSYPIGLTFDNLGDLFEADYNSGNIYEFTPDGTQSTFASGLNAPFFLAFQPVPELSGVITNGAFELAVSMPSPYYSTIIETSSNLVNWVSVYTNTPPFILTNSIGTASSQDFYRGVLGP